MNEDVDEDWRALFKKYIAPPFQLDGASTNLSISITAQGAGIPFHYHDSVMAETIYGRKRWFMTNPRDTPTFHPNQTTLQWFYDEYPNLSQDISIYECTTKQGEVDSYTI